MKRPLRPVFRLLLPVLPLVLLAALLAPVLRTEGVAGTLRKARTDFVALKCLADAAAAASGRPVRRAVGLTRLNRAVQLAPREPVVRDAAPALYRELGDYRAAYGALLRQPPGDRDLLLAAECLLKLGHVEAGKRLLLSAAGRIPRDLDRGTPLAGLHALELNNIGYTLADAGVALPQARDMLQDAIAVLPLQAVVEDSMGWVYYRMGDYRKAVFYLERAVRLETGPGAAEIYYHLGATYAREGRWSRARRFLLLALRLDPGDEEARDELSRLRWRLPGPNLTQAGGPPGSTSPSRT